MSQQKDEWLLYSIITNINNAINKNEPIDDLKEFEFSFHGAQRFQKYAFTYKKILTELYNNYYTWDELILHFLYSQLFYKKINLKNVTVENVKAVSDYFTEESLKKDKETLLKINSKLSNVGGISTFFKLDEIGKSIIYRLIVERKYITLYFWIRFGYFFHTENKNTDKEDIEHKRFRSIMLLFNTQLKRMERV
jgi:hypothetical protein